MSNQTNDKIYDNFAEEKDREAYFEKKYGMQFEELKEKGSKKPFNFISEADEFIFNEITKK